MVDIRWEDFFVTISLFIGFINPHSYSSLHSKIHSRSQTLLTTFVIIFIRSTAPNSLIYDKAADRSQSALDRSDRALDRSRKRSVDGSRERAREKSENK